jgi:hypothetical protein
MSTPPTALPATSSSLANFQAVFHTSLKAYEKHTKQDLLAHPLVVRLHNCDSPAAILTILRDQVQEFEQSRILDQRLTKWLDPTVNVLLAFSEALGAGVSLVRLSLKSARLTPRPRSNIYLQVFSPATVIFAGAGVLLSVSSFLDTIERSSNILGSQAAKDVSESQDVLVDLFERVENFFKRLETYLEVPPTAAMTDIIVKIMVEVLNIFAISTKEIKQGRTSTSVPVIFGCFLIFPQRSISRGWPGGPTWRMLSSDLIN